MTPPGTLLSIQYLRGLAALAVVVVHLGWVPFSAGHAGVDVFFVISGFIMMHTSRREPTPGVFLAARAIRVLPLWWLIVLVTAAANSTSRVSDPPWRVLASLVLWPTQRWDGEWQFIVGPGWTLAYEAAFYLAFAVALLLPARRRLPALTAGFLLACAGAGLAAPDVLRTFGISPMLLLEFLGGAWLHRAWQGDRLPGSVIGWALILAGAAAIFSAPFMGGNVMWRPVTLGVPALLVAAGGLTLERRGHLPRVPGLMLLGNASYALYLTHELVLGQVAHPLRPLPGAVAVPCALAACVAAAILVHRWAEQPMGRWLSRQLTRWRGVAQPAGA